MISYNKSETGNTSVCLLVPLRNKKWWQPSALLNYRDMIHTRCEVTAAALLIACLLWMIGYLIPTHSTLLLFTLAEAWGGSWDCLWPYGEGGRAPAEWLGASCLSSAQNCQLNCTEAADDYMKQHNSNCVTILKFGPRTLIGSVRQSLPPELS